MLASAFSGYRLPRTDQGKLVLAVDTSMGSPALVARNGSDLPVGNTSLLTAPHAGVRPRRPGERAGLDGRRHPRQG